MEQFDTISKFDRIFGGLNNVALFTAPSTIKNVQNLTGKTETFIVQSCRHEDFGDYVFVECIDENGVTRIVLPPKVVAAIRRQDGALTKRNRSRSAKATMQARKDAGEVIGFQKRKA
jgi:hypothetical protein